VVVVVVVPPVPEEVVEVVPDDVELAPPEPDDEVEVVDVSPSGSTTALPPQDHARRSAEATMKRFMTSF
jgi:hypothetical protein